MLGRAASCCDLLRLSPTPGDSSEDDDQYTHVYIIINITYNKYNVILYNIILLLLLCERSDRRTRVESSFRVRSHNSFNTRTGYADLYLYINAHGVRYIRRAARVWLAARTGN